MSREKVEYEIVHKNGNTNDLPYRKQAPKGFGARHTQSLILFICLTVAFTMRAQLSVSMVAMTSHDFGQAGHDIIENVTELHSTKRLRNASQEKMLNESRYKGLSKWNVYRKYDWDKPTQEMILFSFFVGYTSMMIPMGVVAQKFGGKIPIMFALAANAVISIITPWVPIFGGWVALSLCRVFQGATQAALYPSIHTILGKWAPISERGRLSTYVYSGSQFGTIIIFQLAGVFAGSPTLGWPATFWLCGVLSFFSFVLIWWLGAATPHDDPRISVEEITFILEGGSSDVVPKRRRTPWKSILSSKAVWAIVIAHAGSASGYLLMLTQIPTYMNFVLGVEIKKNGVYSSLPYVAMYVTLIMFGYLADYAMNKKIMSVVNIRRTANTIGVVVEGLCLIGFSYISSMVPAVVVLVISMSLHSAVHVGFHINHIDLAPNFAGPIMALGNMVANLTSLLVPVVVSNVVKDDMRNQARWQTVFLIFVGLQVATNAVFLIFVKGNVQQWNFDGEENETKTQDRRKSSIFFKKNSFKENIVMTNSQQ